MLNSFEIQQEFEELYLVVNKQIETQEWRLKLSDISEIYEEQCVDSLEKFYQSGPNVQNDFEDWEQFKIMKSYKDVLVLQQIQDENNIKVLGRWSSRIEKANTHSEQIQKWKSSLAPGMKILFFECRQFVESTILEISRGPKKQNPIREIPQTQKKTDNIQFLIAQRIYVRDGNKNDEIGVFSGWS
eukprot:403348411